MRLPTQDEETTWWHPDRMAERLPRLQQRARIVAGIRQFFTERAFLEVETPILQISPGLEPHLRAFTTTLESPFGEAHNVTRYLHTSPEFAMKKLLAAGLPRIFQMSRVFRNGERSDTHHPEFTMLEWYRAGATYGDLMDDIAGLLSWLGETRPVERLSVAEAFTHYAGIDVLATIADPTQPAPDPRPLLVAARRLGLNAGDGLSWDDAFFVIFLALIEPRLGFPGPTILYDWPLCMAALARRSKRDPRVAERFEVYVDGVELANGFGELTDAAEQERRFAHDMALKERLYGHRYPIDAGFLKAVGQLPDPCAGIALGVDRLVMRLTGATAIDHVLWAPVE